MKKQIVRISILQSSKIVVALYCVMGFLYTVIGMPMMVYGHNAVRTMGVIYFFAPVWLSIIGFICFVIFGASYNFLAGWLGGFEFEVKDGAEES